MPEIGSCGVHLAGCTASPTGASATCAGNPTVNPGRVISFRAVGGPPDPTPLASTNQPSSAFSAWNELTQVGLTLTLTAHQAIPFTEAIGREP